MAKNLIGTRWLDASTSAVVNVMNPATGKVIDTVPESTTKDCDAAVSSSKKAQRIWSKKTLNERAEILNKFSQVLERDKELLSSLLCEETGKTIKESNKEVSNLINGIKLFCEKAKHEYGMSIPSNSNGTIALTTREPLGIVVVITSFINPSETFLEKVIPALLMGNSVIIKPSTLSPLTINKYAELLLESGIDGGTINIVNGKNDCISESLASNPNVSLVSFTGTTSSGLNIYKCCSKNLTKVQLQLSSNDALILDRDGDIDLAVEETIKGRLSNAGQVCNGSKRFLIHNSVKKEYIRKLKEKLLNIKCDLPNNPDTNMGCLINEEASLKVENQIRATLNEGATLIMGGKRKGTFYEPTIIDNVNKNMSVAKDMEILGPVISIIGFDDINEAVKIANQSSYGLNNSIFTKDINTAMTVSSQLESGTTIINGTTTDSFEFPQPAHKFSGLSTDGISSILKEMSNTKCVVLKNVIK